MIEQLQHSFDMGEPVIVQDVMFSPSDAHVVLSIYDKLSEKNKQRFEALGADKMKKLGAEI